MNMLRANDTTLSLCLITMGQHSHLLNVVLQSVSPQVQAAKGEVIVVGDVTGLEEHAGITQIAFPREAGGLNRSKLRNFAASYAKGEILLFGDDTSIMAPVNWPQRLLEWCRPIAADIAYIFGLRVVTSLSLIHI